MYRIKPDEMLLGRIRPAGRSFVTPAPNELKWKTTDRSVTGGDIYDE